MNTYYLSALDEQFKYECKVINLSYEYPGYTGKEKWAIITDLTEKELIEKYDEIISSYKPFILLFSLFGSVRADYIRNEDKFSKRAKRSISIFDFSEETEEHHTEIASNELEEEAISNEMAKQVQAAIAQLKPIQRERLIKYFFEGKTLLQIAAEEGKSYSTVYESYENGINYKELSSAMPYMFTDRPEHIDFIADIGIIDQVIDWFGSDIRIAKTDDENKVRISVKASPNAMVHWAMQYANYVEIISPEPLRMRVKEALENGLKKYCYVNFAPKTGCNTKMEKGTE